MWKCRTVESVEIQRHDFHSSHRPWKSLRDSHIPTRTANPFIIAGELRTASAEVLPMSSDKSVTYVPGRSNGVFATESS